mgnify:CR=1 FL=1
MINPRLLYFLSFIFAFCSLCYEFMLANALSLLFGGTEIRYMIVIGLYMGALGFGSLITDPLVRKFKNPYYLLIIAELFLILITAVTIKLVIEIDGRDHDSKEEYDNRRERTLENLGLHFIRFSNHQIYNNLDGCIDYLERYMKGDPNCDEKRPN